MTIHNTEDEKLWPYAFANIEAAAIAIDPGHDRILAVNPAAEALLESRETDLRHASAAALFAPYRGALIVLTEECLVRGTAWSDALSIQMPDRERRRNVEIFASRFAHEGRDCVLLLLHRLDLVRMRRAKADYERMRRTEDDPAHDVHVEKLFRDLERGNQLILNAAGEGIYGINARGQTTFLNPAAEEMLGWRSEELVGRNAHQVMHHSHEHGEPYPLLECPIYAAFRDGAVHRVTDEVFWRRDGSCFPVEYTSTPIEDGGQLVGAVVVFRDVSTQREADGRLLAALAEVKALTKRLEKENAFLLDEIRSGQAFGEIVGDSTAVRALVSQIEMVAHTDATVLITGESGTGKELIAHAIHDASPRAHRPFITVNCAAIPRDLFESEFFGHKKGAFTGALADRIGRFEMADGGTIFLDEIGEMPLEMQGKLLRALQEGQFERVGDATTITSDFRVIAATNRDLHKAVSEQRFREDLFYRIAVFPIEAAPLRQRTGDIPALVGHFLGQIARQRNEPAQTVSIADMERLKRYQWPGNIRELRNVVEHATIVSQSGRAHFPLLGTERSPPTTLENAQVEADLANDPPILTEPELRALEQTNIARALAHTGGRVSGPGGAADLLKVKPQTLYSKIKRLGLTV